MLVVAFGVASMRRRTASRRDTGSSSAMSKKRLSPTRLTKRGKCSFCDRVDLSETHIWPQWIKRYVPRVTGSFESVYRLNYSYSGQEVTHKNFRTSNNDIFSQTPRLACIPCNSGWMKQFEDDLIPIAESLITANPPVRFGACDFLKIARWLTLIVILSELSSKRTVCISEDDRKFIKYSKNPPNHWTISIAVVNNISWSRQRVYHPSIIFDEANLADAVPKFNTQVTSLGIGQLYAQIFTSPVSSVVEDYRISVGTLGLTQIWPIPASVAISADGGLPWPIGPVLSGEQAQHISDAFHLALIRAYQEPTGAD